MEDIERIFKRIDTYRELVIELQRELTRRVALGPENGGEGEYEKFMYLKKLIDELKPDSVYEINAPDSRVPQGYRPNMVALWEGAKKDINVWVLSHMDIVPPGDMELWSHDPFKIAIDGDRISGRGVEDNHHGIISPYLAIKAIKEEGLRPGINSGLVMVSDEETGSKYGLSYILNNKRELFSEDDLIIVPDGGDSEGRMIEIAEKSMLWLSFTLEGKQCHASTPEKGNNTLVGASKLIIALEELKDIFNAQDMTFKPPVSTFCPTRMEENVPNVNTIPGRNVFYMDCRVLPCYTADEVFERCKQIASRVAEDTGLKIDVGIRYREDSAPPTPPDAPVVKTLKSAIKRVKGISAEPQGIGGGTVAAFFRKAGLPSAVWLTMPDSAHQPNEFCFIKDILEDAKVFAFIYMGCHESDFKEVKK